MASNAGVVSLFPSEFWGPVKVCHGFHKQNLGRLTTFLFQSCKSSQIPLHEKRSANITVRTTSLMTAMTLFGPGHNRPLLPEVRVLSPGREGSPDGLQELFKYPEIECNSDRASELSARDLPVPNIWVSPLKNLIQEIVVGLGNLYLKKKKTR